MKNNNFEHTSFLIHKTDITRNQNIMSQTQTAIKNAAMKKRISVDSIYIRNVYLKLRYDLIQEILKNNGPDINQQVKDMDVQLIGIMKDVLSGCEITDVKDFDIKGMSDKEVLWFLVSKEEYIDNIDEDKDLSRKLKEEMDVFDDICIDKGEKLINYNQFSDRYVKHGEEKIAEYLVELDRKIAVALKDNVDYQQLEKEVQEEGEAMNLEFSKYRDTLANSIFSLYNLQSNGNLQEVIQKYETLKAKTEFLLEKK
ncbi:hypothetical protein ACO0R3_003617 [Hanseniaspora guilliermondii]